MISVGELNLANSVIDNEFRIAVLEYFINFLMSKQNLSQSDLKEIPKIKNRIANDLKKKYPSLDLQFPDFEKLS
ncbi:MAG: hypothetical protein U0Y10_11195 [Spirosomataceae bacterium]